MNETLLNCIIRISNFPSIYQKENLSPENILKQSGYFNLFSDVTLDLITKYLENKSEIVKTWIQYSEDIRHSPAWGFGPTDDGKWIVTYRDNVKIIEKHIYDRDIDACAKMVKMTAESIRIGS
jgi:hypothetical protein